MPDQQQKIKSLDRRNHEINLVYAHLRHKRMHDSAWCIEFIRRNYFFDSNNQVYNILGMKEDFEESQLDLSQASIIYHIVTNDNYHELFSLYDLYRKQQA